MLEIGVLGYYGYGNAGDEVILDNIRSFISGLMAAIIFILGYWLFKRVEFQIVDIL